MTNNQTRRYGPRWRRGVFVETACATGITSGWRFATRYAIPVLAYHGISETPPGSWTPLRRQVSPLEFESHLRGLAKHYEFIALDTAIDVLRGRLPRRPNCLVLTFDDGYRNNLTYALPILSRFGAPATIFLPTGHIESREPLWFDRVDFALNHLNGRAFEVRVAERGFQIEPQDRESLRKTFESIRGYVKQALADYELRTTMASFAEELESRAGCSLAAALENDVQCGLVGWDEVRANCGGLITWGSHTVDHVRLARIDEGEARRQLMRSRETLETITGAPCSAIAYPNGDWNPEIASLAAECGYQAGLTSDEGLNEAGRDTMSLRRIGIGPGLSANDVLVRTCGLSQSFSHVIRFPWRGSHERYDRRAV